MELVLSCCYSRDPARQIDEGKMARGSEDGERWEEALGAGKGLNYRLLVSTCKITYIAWLTILFPQIPKVSVSMNPHTLGRQHRENSTRVNPTTRDVVGREEHQVQQAKNSRSPLDHLPYTLGPRLRPGCSLFPASAWLFR
jgi:hypothetical protein